MNVIASKIIDVVASGIASALSWPDCGSVYRIAVLRDGETIGQGFVQVWISSSDPKTLVVGNAIGYRVLCASGIKALEKLAKAEGCNSLLLETGLEELQHAFTRHGAKPCGPALVWKINDGQ